MSNALLLRSYVHSTYFPPIADAPVWKTVSMKSLGPSVDSPGSDGLFGVLPAEFKRAQSHCSSVFNTVFMFPTVARRAAAVTADKECLEKVKELEAMLTPECVGIGCASQEVTGVNTPSEGDSGAGPMQGTFEETSGTLSLANFPDCIRMVFNITSLSNMDAAMEQTPTMPGEGDWKVIFILTNGSGGNIDEYIKVWLS